MFVGYLSEDFREADDDFQEALSGAKESQPKWRMCMTETDEGLGFALGALFVKEAFQGESKVMVCKGCRSLVIKENQVGQMITPSFNRKICSGQFIHVFKNATTASISTFLSLKL